MGEAGNSPATSLEILEINLDESRVITCLRKETDEQAAEIASLVGEEVVNKLNQVDKGLPFPGAGFRVEPIDGTHMARLFLDWSPNTQNLLNATEFKPKKGGCVIS